MEQPADRSEATDNMIPRSARYKGVDADHFYNQAQDQNQQFRNGHSRCSSRTSMDDTTTEYDDEEDDEDEDEEEEEEEEEENDEESKFRLEEMRYADARMGICSVCSYPITGKNVDPSEFDKALLCANGHLLCYRCVQRFAVKSETNCVLCAAVDSQQSSLGVSRTNSAPNQHYSPHQQPQQQQQQNTTTTTTTTNTKPTPKQRNRRERGGATAPRRPACCRHEPVESNREPLTPTSGATTATSYPFNQPPAARFNDAEFAAAVQIENRSEEDGWNSGEDEEQTNRSSGNKNSSSSSSSKQRSYCSIVQKEKDALLRARTIDGQTMAECSRRPIQCPRQDCAVNVAFSALTNHFIFDHPEVPILSVEPAEKSSFIVNFDGLGYDSSRCLALLLVSGKLSGPAAKQFNGSNVHSPYKNRLPLPILAARLHHDNVLSREAATGDEQPSQDVVIVWVAGLDIGNITAGAIRCSIQAIDSIDSEAFRSLTYTGPINSLRTAQKPRDVFVIGDCIILHDGFISHITTSGCNNLNVNVTIH